MPELIASGQLPLYDYNDAIIAGAAPVNPSPDTLWLDNSVEPNMMKRWDGLAWEPVGELDPTYSETITAIETTLANMADDGLLDYSDRQKLKEDIALITGAIPADTGTLPTGATLDGGTVGSYRRLRKAAVSAGMLTSHAAYTALATAYTTLSTFLNARTPKPWDVSLANKATPTPVDKATFRNAWLGYYNAEAALADETTATLSSGIRTLKDTTIPALENKALSEAEKSAIQTSLNLIIKEKSDLDATSSSYQSNANLIDKTLVSTPKTAYNTSYDALLAAMNDVLDEPTGAAIADAKITAVNTQFTDYGTKLAALRTGFQNAQKAIETKLADDAETAISTALVDYVDKTSYGLDIEKIQNQVDGSIMTHFGANEPTLMNAPASSWSTTVDKDIHLGDLYYDTVSGFAYRFAKTDTVYNWMRIVDTDVTLALRNASTAQDTADAKRRAFYTTPTPPYDLGDLWVQGAGGDLMRCTTAKAAGGSYAAEDWTKAVKYTDDTTVNNLEIGGQNIIPQASIILSGSTLNGYDVATNTWTLSIPNGTARGGFAFTGQNIRIPYGKTYLMSFEVQAPYAATFGWDVNNYPVGTTGWNGNDNDNGSLRKNSATAVGANQWVKCWYLFTNTHTSNTSKVDLYDASNFGINNNTGSTQLVKFRNIKGEFGNRPTEWQPALIDLNASITQAKTDAQTYATTYITNNVQPQIDGKIETFAQTSDPSTAWADAATKTVHSGDIWYNTNTKQTKRWSGTAWITLEDIVANNAAALAATKNKIFTATPTIPYKAGDFWINNQELYVSSVTRDTGSYTAGDWKKAVKYTDDTAAAAAAQAASDAQADADTANTAIGEITSDNKLTGNEKSGIRLEWNALTSQAVANSAQASTFGVSATNYQNAIAALGTYLNGGTALTYAQCTGGTIPLWIADANLSITTTIVGVTYRTTWKTYYDAQVALMNAIAAEAKRLANVAQQTADNIQVGGRNLAKETITPLTGASGTMKLYPLTVSAQDFSGKKVVISCDVEWTNKVDGTRLGAEIALSSAEGTVYVGAWNSPSNASSGKTRISNIVSVPVRTYTAIASCASYIQMNATGTKVSNLKVEFANKPSDWSPAPEDVAKDISDVENFASSLQDLTDVTFKDGLIETAEASAIREHLNTLAKENADLSNQYDTIYVNVNLVGNPKTNLFTAKTNYTASYNSLISSINAAISDNRTTTAEKAAVDAAFSSYKDNLKVLTQRLQEAQTAISNKLVSDSESTLKNYVQSRGENLVTNGTALLGNNTNFSGFTFDGYDNYGSKGSFTTTAYNSSGTIDELIPVDPEKSYRMTWYGKTNPYVGAKFYGMVLCYDSDGLSISPSHTMYFAGTLTTLAQDLNPGDTVIRLTSAANWKNAAGTNTHNRQMIVWNHVSSTGYAYPELTYSRNVSGYNTWADGGIDFATNTITLNAPWSRAAVPAGTKVSNGNSGSGYKYISGINVVVPANWTPYTGVISGIDMEGINHNNKFHPATAFVKIGWLINREINGGKLWLSNVSFGIDNATQASLDALSSTTTNLGNYVDGAFHDSVIQKAEAVAIEKHLTDLAKENADMGNQYSTLYNNVNVTGTAKTNLYSAKTAYDTQYTAVTGAVNTAISDGKASDAEKTSVSNAFIAYRDALKLLTQRMQEAQIAISDYLSTQKANAISIGGRNMIVSGTLTSSKYVSETNGTVLVDAGNGHDVTDFIPCDANTAYMLSTKTRLYQIRVAYYSASKVFISGALYGLDQGKQKAVSTPATTAFMRWSGDRANGDALTLWKLEKGNKATDWTPAPEDVSAQIAASNTNINNLRQSLDSKRDIRLGMKLGFSGFSTVNANYIYFCGLATNTTTFAEELSNTDGSLYDRGTQTTLTIPKQALNLTGIVSGTSGYLVWNSSDGTNKIWFITLQNTYDASGTMTASKWMKRNIGTTGDNTEMVLTDAVYVLGELEI